MKFIPFENYFIKTAVPVNEVMMRLDDRIFPGGTSILNSFPETIKPYRGTVKNNQFKIIRIHKGFRDREPEVIINGRVYMTNTETVIHVKMRLNTIHIIFLALWLSGVMFGTIRLILRMINEHKFYADIFWTLLAFAIAYIVSVVPIINESRKFKILLNDLLRCTFP